MALLGATLGSFAGAQVWRLRARQLVQDKQHGEPTNKQELSRLSPLVRSARSDRSQCLHCRHQLAWYDLLPLVSWLALGGKCRYCRHPIGWFEPAMEVGLAVVFVFSYVHWPGGLHSTASIASFGLWLVACVLMAILFAYDAKWYLLPFSINTALIVVAILFVGLQWAVHAPSVSDVLSLLLGVAIMAGLYFLFSLAGWVGLGDSILGVGLALLLGTWEVAFLALFLANLLGCLMLLPLAVQKKLHRGVRIPFGPFLIAGTVIAMLWGSELIALFFDWSNAVLTPLML